MKMTKSGLVMGAAAIACAVMQGCKAPKAQRDDYLRNKPTQQEQSRPTYRMPEPVVNPVVTPAPQVENKCLCPKGAVHETSCGCGAANCACKVVAPKPKTPDVKPAAKTEFTEYTIRRGDYLAKISKAHNVRQSAILAANPGLKADKLYIGRKIRIPGNVALKPAPVTTRTVAGTNTVAKTIAPRKVPRAAYKPYTGATKEYTVKNGDILGRIAVASGISVRALKELNKLTKNDLRIGQKLKIPAEKVVEQPVVVKTELGKTSAGPASPEKDKDAKIAGTAEQTAEKKVEPPVETLAPKQPKETAEQVPTPPQPKIEEPTKPAETAPEAPKTYTVQEGEDLFGIALKFNITPSALKDLNNLTDNDQIPAGTVLKLPAGAKTSAQ